MNTSTPPNTLYRFRSIDALLDKYQELENQTIYFASPDELNDPMEGFQDIVWRGDKIVWTNFFKHYVYCLHASCLQLIAGNSVQLHADSIPIFGRWDQLPTPQVQRLFDCVWKRFLKLPKMPEILEALANTNREIRYRELGTYLRIVHSVLLDEIEESCIEEGFISKILKVPRPEGVPAVSTVLESILTSIIGFEEQQDEEKASALFRVMEGMNDEQRILLQWADLNHPGLSEKDFQLAIYDFPNLYLNEVEKLLWPKWYTACFMKNYHNSSVWGHYGNKHRGVCLIFETVNTCESNGLKFNKVKGKSERTMPFHEVSYADKPEEVDFFRSIGRLSVPELIKLWYTDSENNRSECASHIRPDGNKKEDWQEIYWKDFYRDITTKTKDWAYEQEYRLILGKEIRTQTVHGKKSRTLTYDFNSLKGIIFGIKTSDEDKLRIIEIIRRKCEDNSRESFTFFQAYYSPADGGICKDEMQMRLVSHVGTVASDRLEN